MASIGGPQIGKEVAEDAAAFVGQKGVGHFHAVVESRVRNQLIKSPDATHFRVGGAVDQSFDAGIDQGAGTHGAGLKGDGDGATFQAPGAELGGRFAEGEDLGVCSRIGG